MGKESQVAVALLFGGAGLLLFLGALFNADWLFEMRRSRLWVAVFGRGCARIAFMLIGLLCMAATIGSTLSVLQRP
jgi:hypothetical protein